MDDKRNNQRDGDYRHHPIQRGDQPKPAHFGEIDLKNQPIIGLRQLASREAVLICINGLSCHYWFGLVAGKDLLSPNPPSYPRRFSPGRDGGKSFVPIHHLIFQGGLT